MATRIAIPALLLTAACGGLLSFGLLTAAPATACPEGQLEDTVTRMCWSQSGQGESFAGPGEGPCMPGRVGGCLGSLQQGTSVYHPLPGAVTDW